MNRLLRLALFIGISSGAGLFGLLAWSTGNASRVAQYQGLLLWLNGALALALFVWVVALTVRLRRVLGQLNRMPFVVENFGKQLADSDFIVDH